MSGAAAAERCTAGRRSRSTTEARFPDAATVVLFHPAMSVFDNIYGRVCLGAGYSALSGIRAFLPLGFLALYARLRLFSAPPLGGTPFAFLQRTWVIVLLFVLAAIELAAEKLVAGRATGRTAHGKSRTVTIPLRVLLGGVVFAAAVSPHGTIAMVVCGVIGLGMAWLSNRAVSALRPDARTAGRSTAILVSLFEDIIVVVAAFLFVLVPPLGALFALFIFLLAYRVRTRRRRKYSGLRILK
jgi:hypothetical protein